MKNQIPFFMLPIALVLSMLLNNSAFTFNNDIKIAIKLNKNNFRLHDKIDIEITIKNCSTKNIRILPWMGPYEYNWVILTDLKHKKQNCIEKVTFEINPRFPFKDSYILLASNGLHSLRITGSITKDKDGKMFIEFPYSKIAIENPGEYFIVTKFENSKFVHDEAIKKFNFKDIWQGKVLSEAGRIKIQE